MSKLIKILEGSEVSFYSTRSQDSENNNGRFVIAGFDCVIWTPSLLRIVPAVLLKESNRGNMLGLHHLVYFWLWHCVFSLTRDDTYFILFIFQSKQLVHFSVVRSKDFRFPFMDPDDIQIGPVWTHCDMRRRGLAKDVLRKVVKWLSRSDRRCWWICASDNVPSNCVARSVGMVFEGVGEKKCVVGFARLGVFRIKKAAS